MPVSIRKKRMAPFGALFAPQIAGWHDGQKATINFDFLNNDAVFHHEQAHETIYLKTADGFLFSVLDRIIEHGVKVDKRITRRIITTSKTLFDTSIVAHEIAATYIGLKMLTPAEAEIARRCLPPDYLEYYEAASQVIDPYFGSTNLQVLVLSTVAHFSFGSLFLEQYFCKNWPSYKKLRSEYQPTFRLQTILNYLAGGKVVSLRKAIDAAAEDFFQKRGLEPWDLDAEDEWIRIPIAAHLLDLVIARSVEVWLMEQNIFQYLTGDRKLSALTRLNKKCSELGFMYDLQPINRVSVDDFELMRSTDIKDFLDSYTDGESIVAAQRQSATLIQNGDAVKVPYLKLEEFTSLSLFLHAERLVIVAADPYDEEAAWTIVASGSHISNGNVVLDGVPHFAVQSSYADVMQWLYSMDEGGWLGVEPELLILSFGSVRGSALHDTYPRHISERWNERSVFYPVGDWASVIAAGVKSGGLAAAEICVYIKAQEITGDPDTLPAVFLKMIRGEQVPGNCIFRPFSRNANRAMAVLQNQWEKQTSYKVLSTTEARESGFDVAGVVTAFSCLMAFWTFF